MFNSALRELFRDEEQDRYNNTLIELQKEVARLRSSEQIQREKGSPRRDTDQFQETLLKRIDGLQDTVHAQRAELQEQRLILLRMLEYHHRILRRINDLAGRFEPSGQFEPSEPSEPSDPGGQLVVDLDDTY